MRVNVVIGYIMMLWLVVACSNGSTGENFGRELCANTEAFLTDDPELSFTINSKTTEALIHPSVRVLGAKINQLNKKLDIPMKLEPELAYPLYIHKSLKHTEGNVCMLTGFIRIEFDGDQRELILVEISDNEITPISILGAEFSFAECTMSVYSQFVEEDIVVKKVNRCMEKQVDGAYELQTDTTTYLVPGELMGLTNNHK